MGRKLFVALTTLVAFGLIAPAASADIQGAGTFSEVNGAAVGRHFVDRFTGAQIDCTKDTVKAAEAVGQGLFLPPATPAPTANGVWSLHLANIMFVGTPAGLSAGTLDACGWLQHVGREDMGGVGPACGASKGHSGRGQINFVPARGVNLFDLGWKTSAGGTLPVTGKYQVWDGTKPNKAKQNKWGNIIAEVQAQGGDRCLETKNCSDQKTAPNPTVGCGAQRFSVVGTFELVQVGSKDQVIRPKTEPGACKDTENELCAYDDNQFGKEPAPGSKTG